MFLHRSLIVERQQVRFELVARQTWKTLQAELSNLESGVCHGYLWVNVWRHQSEVDGLRLVRNDLDLLLTPHGVSVVHVDHSGTHQGLGVNA